MRVISTGFYAYLFFAGIIIHLGSLYTALELPTVPKRNTV